MRRKTSADNKPSQRAVAQVAAAGGLGLESCNFARTGFANSTKRQPVQTIFGAVNMRTGEANLLRLPRRSRVDIELDCAITWQLRHTWGALARWRATLSGFHQLSADLCASWRR